MIDKLIYLDMEDLIAIDDMFLGNMKDPNKAYKCVAIKSSEKQIRDILNTEVILAQPNIKKDIRKKAKAYHSFYSQSMLMSLRYRCKDINKNIAIYRYFLESYKGDRYHVPERSGKLVALRDGMVRYFKELGFTINEITEILNMCDSNVKDILYKRGKKLSNHYTNIMDLVMERADKTHKLVLEYQDRVLYVRTSTRSKKYHVIDLKEEGISPLRFSEKTEKEVDEIFERYHRAWIKKLIERGEDVKKNLLYKSTLNDYIKEDAII